ncbi:MAG: hypothetical protein EZS28_026386, partial [Streblomastix strix]
DDALLVLKAEKTQLIDSYTKGETNNLLNNKADSGISYTKQEDDALLLLKADKSELIDAYTKGETNNLLNNKADSGVSYTKGEDDALLLLNANQSTNYTKTETDQLISQIEVGDIDLSGYMTLGTSKTITANKTFNNACRFISSIDGMGTITGSQFVKSGADDSVVLLGAGGTKPISEFAGVPTDLSNYYTKTQTYSKTETDNKYVRLEGSIQQTITGRLKYVSPFGETYDETQDPATNTYLTQSEVDAKLTNYVNTTNNQEINGTKTFNSNVNAAGFAKTGKDDTSVLLAGGGDMLLSSFGGAVDITNVLYTYFRSNFESGNVKVNSTTWANTQILRISDAAGLSDFPELYAYIKERYPKPIGELPQPVPIGDQTLQQQVKNNDDIIYTSNEVFEPPVPNAITKLDLSSQLERQSFLASSGSDPQLIVYGDRITLTASYTTTGVFPNGYLFKNYPAEARPKQGDQVIALVGTDASNTYNIFCYIDQGGPFIISSRWLPSNTALVLNITYYKNYESSKKINYDANNDGKIDIMDTWNQNGKGQFEAQSYVYETVKNQTNLIEAGVQGLNRTNYLNSEIKLVDELAIYKANRAAYFIKDGPFITYSFGAKLAQLGANYEAQQTVYKLFSTISKKVLPPNTKYMPIHVEQQEFSAMYLFKDTYDKSSAVQVAVSGQLNTLDCEFQGTYILDNYTNSTKTNESAPNEAASDSFIDEVIIKNEKQIGSSPQPQYTITNVYNQFMINDFFPSSAYNTFYIVDDGTCRVCVFNLYFESKGLDGRTQEVGRIPDSVIPADGKSLGLPAGQPQESTPTDSDDPQSRNELATSKPLPIVQPMGPRAPSIGLANGFMNGLYTLSFAHQRPFPTF